MTVWGESRVSGLNPGWTGNSTGNSRWEFWWPPRIKPEISGLNRAWDRAQTEPAQKHVWAWLSLSGPKFGWNRIFSVGFTVRFPVKPEIRPRTRDSSQTFFSPKELEILFDQEIETGGERCLVSKKSNPRVHRDNPS
jgi:hypothetical protein